MTKFAEEQRRQVALMPASATTSGATLSPCERYRYHLWRTLVHYDPPRCGPVLFVMLNPSTADASIDDPTIRKCAGFAGRLGSRRVEVVNLYAYRATYPADLVAYVDAGVTAAATIENDAAIAAAARSVVAAGGLAIAAWGAHFIAGRGGRDMHVTDLLRAAGAEVMCLGVSKSGAPRHPLMLAYDTPLVRWA